MEELTVQRGHTFCMKTVKTVFGLGSEGGEERRDEAGRMTTRV